MKISKNLQKLKISRFSLSILFLSLSLISLALFLYYQYTKYTVADYESELISKRNQLIKQADDITVELSGDTSNTEILESINQLETENSEFRTLVESKTIPDKGESFKALNLEFSQNIEDYIKALKEYFDLFEDDRTEDVQQKLTDLNDSIEKINNTSQEIQEKVQKN